MASPGEYVERTRLKLNFANRDALRDLWDRELRRGQLFIPSNQTCPVDTPVTLVLAVPEAPAPLALNGDVKLARSPQHCAAGQKPGIGIEVILTRRKRKGIEAYLDGNWDRAGSVMEGHTDEPKKKSSASGSRFGPRSTARAGSVVAVKRLAKPKETHGNTDPAVLRQEAKAFLDKSEGADFYTVLDVPRDATRKPIRSNYIKLVRQFHPDTYYDRVDKETLADLERCYQRITRAYEVLIQPDDRERYDDWLSKNDGAGSASKERARPAANSGSVAGAGIMRKKR